MLPPGTRIHANHSHLTCTHNRTTSPDHPKSVRNRLSTAAKKERHADCRPARHFTKLMNPLLDNAVANPCLPRRRVRRVPQKLELAILCADLTRTEFWLSSNIKCRKKKGVVKRVSKHLTAKLTRLHRQRAQKMVRFHDTRTKIGATLELPPAMNRRVRLKTIKSIVEYKLLPRNTFQTLYHVSLSSLHHISLSENSIDTEPHPTAQQIHTTSLSRLRTTFPLPIFPLEPAACTHPSSRQTLDRSPWLIPPWCSTIDPPPILTLLPAAYNHPISHLFMDRRLWLIPPWLTRILSAPQSWLVPPVPNGDARLPSLAFLQLQPWIVPPWLLSLLR